ncbi:MAG: ABC transporter ATP-binding protein [Sphaerochaetaceae bacterium]
MSEILLEVNHLKKYFKTPKGLLHAVDDVSFNLEKGTTLGIVGESGCGKSTLGRTLLRLIEPTSGEIKFEGKDVLSMNQREMRQMRQEMQIIFQDPFSSLDPRKTVYQSIAEPIIKHKLMADKKKIESRVISLMETVGLAERLYNAYPHELDGGRRQRVGIARALSLEPKFIVCDEPVSALDVSIQAQIINLLKTLQREMGLTYVFITHDLSVVKHLSDDIAVMYLGKIIERASARDLFANPVHPYTKALLSAIPIPDLDHKAERIILTGEIASPINLSGHCRFCKRCYVSDASCTSMPDPELKEISSKHFAACHLMENG